MEPCPCGGILFCPSARAPRPPSYLQLARRRALEKLAENTQTVPSTTTGGTK